MKKKRSGVLLLSLILLVLIGAVAASAAPVPDLVVTNVDGTWSNPLPAGVTSQPCYNLLNTPAVTDENKVYAGNVNSDPAKCYTDPPYNAAPHNNGLGYQEGSGFGFDGKNGTLNVPPATPFLLGLITHYNRRISSGSGLDGAQLNIATNITGATPAAPTFQYNVVLDETPNNPDSNPGNTCPYPAGSFYSAAYLAFNGGYTVPPYVSTFGTPFTHPNVGGNPPLAQRNSAQWLCGDGITATLVGGVEQQFEIGGETYTLQLLGVSYPTAALQNSPNAAADLEICGQYPGANNTSVVFETKELETTPGCLWAQFGAPSAVGLVAVGAAAAPAAGPLLLAGLLVVLLGLSLALWRRAERAPDM